ncbi:MAG: phosphoserine phosphatase, partial [Enterobacterales bacterium]
KLAIDFIVKPWGEKDIKPKLLIMDMDSTLVQAETIDEIARIAGVGDKVAKITESAMRGELDFTESLIARVSMLKGISLETLAKVHERLPLTAGAICLLQKAKENGCHTALVSGGFTLFAGPIATQLSFDTLSANTLEIENNTLTGKVTGDIVDGESKLKTLKQLQKKLGINASQIVAIGDGANDLPMLSAAGTGIAFHAKPKVQEQAKTILNFNNLEAVCWFLNW